MDGWEDGEMDGCMEMGEWMEECVSRWVEAWVSGWIGGYLLNIYYLPPQQVNGNDHQLCSPRGFVSIPDSTFHFCLILDKLPYLS